MAILYLLLFFFIVVLSSKRIILKEHGIIISKEGIENNTIYSKHGLIKWKDISEFKIVKSLNVDLIGVKLNDPEVFILDKYSNFITRKSAKLNLKKHGVSFLINVKILNTDYDFIFTLDNDNKAKF